MIDHGLLAGLILWKRMNPSLNSWKQPRLPRFQKARPVSEFSGFNHDMCRDKNHQKEYPSSSCYQPFKLVLSLCLCLIVPNACDSVMKFRVILC